MTSYLIRTTLPHETGVAAVVARADFFALRAPALPFATLNTLTEPLKVTHAGESHSHCERSQLPKLEEKVCSRVLELACHPVLREGIWLASPSLSAEIDAWERDPASVPSRRVIASVFKYVVRASSRCTPFGLFAACSSGTIGTRTDLRLSAAAWHRRTRLDGRVAHRLHRIALFGTDLWQLLPVEPNPTLRRVGQRYHYIEPIEEGTNTANLTDFALNAFDATPDVERILTSAKGGMSPRELAKSLAEPDVDEQAWLGFIRQLMEAHVLSSGGDLVVASDDPLEAFIRRAELSDCTLGKALRRLHAAVTAIDRGGVGQAPTVYNDLTTTVTGLLPLNPDQPVVQVDSSRSLEDGCLGVNVVTEFLNGAALLQHLGRPQDWLADFRERFVERYERFTQVPLLEVLDPQCGIGWTTPSLVDDLSREAKDVLWRLWYRSMRQGALEVELTEPELAALGNGKELRMPSSFFVHGTIVAKSGDDVSAGNFRVLISSVGGPSGVALLARLCHCDQQLHDFVHKHVEQEEATEPDTILVDVAHCPASHAANVVWRVPLRKFALPVLARTGETQTPIPLDDLLVSVCDNEVVLWSRRHNKRVVPRLDTAQSFHAPGNLPLYTFLGFLQRESLQPSRNWSWGQLEGAPFLPRVAVGRVVLRRAEWNVWSSELEGDTSESALRACIATWRLARGLPRRVYLVERDQLLLVDFDVMLSLDAFLSRVKRDRKVRLVEHYPDDSELVLESSDGRYCHEIVIPFSRSPSLPREACPPPSTPGTSARSVFAPSTEWHYVKVYGGEKVLDYMLRTIIAPLVDTFDAMGVDRWFFIRYDDAEHHLRFRIHGDPEMLRREVAPRIDDAFGRAMASGLTWRLQRDTYRRELGRYGGLQGINYAEQLFTADSRTALALLTHYADQWGEIKTSAAVSSVLAFLGDLPMSADDKCLLLNSGIRDHAPLRRRHRSKVYRELRKQIDACVVGTNGRRDAYGELRDAILLRSQQTKLTMGEWLHECRKANTPTSRAVMSVVHMSLNRLGIARTEEDDVYDFALRTLRSQVARQPRAGA